jgi:hypothetical protein
LTTPTLNFALIWKADFEMENMTLTQVLSALESTSTVVTDTE